jgi:hypothetical protein
MPTRASARPPSGLNRFLTGLKSIWNLLVQAATWIAAYVASLLLPPVSGVIEGGDASTSPVRNYAAFIIGAVIVISFVLGQVFNKKKHVWIWVILTIIFLASSIYSINRNYDLNGSLVCTCQGQAIIKGKDYKDEEIIKRFFPQGVDCAIVCTNFKNKEGKVEPERVWAENSINENRQRLFKSYVICFPLVALTIISAVQIIYCSRSRRR